MLYPSLRFRPVMSSLSSKSQVRAMFTAMLYPSLRLRRPWVPGMRHVLNHNVEPQSTLTAGHLFLWFRSEQYYLPIFAHCRLRCAPIRAHGFTGTHHVLPQFLNYSLCSRQVLTGVYLVLLRIGTYPIHYFLHVIVATL